MSEQYIDGAGVVPKKCVCPDCDGEGHSWSGDICFGECYTCGGRGILCDHEEGEHNGLLEESRP